MDIYERLKQDHDHHRALAARILETEGNSEERRQLWERFKPEAEAHAAAEEQTFYGALIEKPDGQEKARHSINEHFTAACLIKELSELDMGSGGWLNKFKKLKHELEHHMEEEENEVFTRARKVLSEETANGLTAKFEDRKQDELAER